jgi:hypothetical protein
MLVGFEIADARSGAAGGGVLLVPSAVAERFPTLFDALVAEGGAVEGGFTRRIYAEIAAPQWSSSVHGGFERAYAPPISATASGRAERAYGALPPPPPLRGDGDAVLYAAAPVSPVRPPVPMDISPPPPPRTPDAIIDRRCRSPEGALRPLTATPGDHSPRGSNRMRPGRQEGAGRPLSAVPSDKGKRMRPSLVEGRGRPPSRGDALAAAEDDDAPASDSPERAGQAAAVEQAATLDQYFSASPKSRRRTSGIGAL